MTTSAIAFFLAIAGLLCAQTTAFEVASIKPNQTGSGSSTEGTTRGRFTGINVSVSNLIQSAFGVRSFQITGGPGWLTSAAFDIAATTGDPRELNDKELRPYLQSLLADRFHLRYRRETTETQVYALTVAKGGTHMTAHAGEGDSSANVSNAPGKSSIVATNCSMENLAQLLGGRMDRVVTDYTGLKGGYDVRLEWSPDPTPESGLPSLFSALTEQLGLKLESAKGPVELIVIENLEPPTEN